MKKCIFILILLIGWNSTYADENITVETHITTSPDFTLNTFSTKTPLSDQFEQHATNSSYFTAGIVSKGFVINSAEIIKTIIEWKTQYKITIKNIGNLLDTYNLSVDLPAGWNYSISKNNVSLNSKEITTLTLNVTSKINELIGVYPITVTATSQTNSSITDFIQLNAIVTRQDLSIHHEDIVFSNENPIEEHVVTVYSSISNNMGIDAENVTVRFFDGHPTQSMQIGSDKIIDLIPLHEKRNVSVRWITKPEVHNIYVEVEPFTLIPEIDESNNLAFKPLNVTYATVVSITPKNITTSIGGKTTPIVRIDNFNMFPDSFKINLTGISKEWYSLDNELLLGAKETAEIPLEISIPDNCSIETGTFPFTISVYSQVLNFTRGNSGNLTIVSGPIIYDIIPQDNLALGSNDVLFSWRTSANSTTELFLKAENETNYTKYAGVDGFDHRLLIQNLTREMNYTYYITSTSTCGSTTTSPRRFYVTNGVIFLNKSNTFTLDRNYDQKASVKVKNIDTIPHALLLQVSNPYDDLVVGFVGNASMDQIITLQPNETKEIDLRIHAPDAWRGNYDFIINLTDYNETFYDIFDYAQVNAYIDPPDVNFTIETISEDPRTLTKTFVIKNYGDPITDMKIYSNEELNPYLAFQPSLKHTYLNNDGYLRFRAAAHLPIGSEGMQGNLNVKVDGVNLSIPADFSCPPGTKVFGAEVKNLTDKPFFVEMRNWYCTNRPRISNSFSIPSGFNPEDVLSAKLRVKFSLPWSRYTYRNHDVNVYLNGNKIGGLKNTIPEGYYDFTIPPEFLNYASEGAANNRIELVTEHMNGGHYVVSSQMSVAIQLDTLTVHVCAHNQSEADELVEKLAEEGNLTFLSFSGNDSICNPAADGVVDPDCVEGTDPDNPLIIPEEDLGGGYFGFARHFNLPGIHYVKVVNLADEIDPGVEPMLGVNFVLLFCFVFLLHIL